MAFSIASGTKFRFALGNRWAVRAVVSSVTSAGSNVTAGDLGLASIDNVVVTPEDATVAIQATPNSTTGSDTSAGSLFLKSASTTTDVHIAVTGRG